MTLRQALVRWGAAGGSGGAGIGQGEGAAGGEPAL